jgi:hypothetical protein
LNRTTQLLWLAVILLSVVGAPACKQTARGGNPKPPVARCMEDLDNIPELAALRARDKGKPEETASGHPLEGLELALTINDQVRASGDPNDVDNWCEHEDSRENFDRLVAALREHQMPPTVDFAIGQNLDPQLAKAWVASGNLLGSMTYSRLKPNKTSAEEFINDLARNDQTLAAYWPSAKVPKYFRYPKFKISLASQDHAKIEKYLSDSGYTVVPATIDAHDEKFSWIYCAAAARNDAACSNLVKAYFKSLLLDTTLKARESARQIAGREVKHILVFRANQFTCDNLAELLAWYKSLGARFIPLSDALADPFYKTVDEDGLPAGLKVFRKVKTSQAEQDQHQ